MIRRIFLKATIAALIGVSAHITLKRTRLAKVHTMALYDARGGVIATVMAEDEDSLSHIRPADPIGVRDERGVRIIELPEDAPAVSTANIFQSVAFGNPNRDKISISSWPSRVELKGFSL